MRDECLEIRRELAILETKLEERSLRVCQALNEKADEREFATVRAVVYGLVGSSLLLLLAAVVSESLR